MERESTAEADPIAEATTGTDLAISSLKASAMRPDALASEDTFHKALLRMGDGFARFGDQVKNVDYVGHGAKVVNYMKEHPYHIAFQIASVAVPGLLVGPALGLLGFGARGIVAGSAAAATQSAISPVAARSIFAVLQSAGAGGYGLPIVLGIFRAVSAISGFFSMLGAMLKEEGQEHVGNGKGHHVGVVSAYGHEGEIKHKETVTDEEDKPENDH